MTRLFKSVTSVALWLLVTAGVSTGHAAPAPKRFALLIGVDQYAQPPNAGQVSNLRGPANDVAEMKALLVDKYGFADKGEIVTLIGKEATVAAIETKFKQHLIKNAKDAPGATVVFYFSGHGSQTQDKDGDEGDGVDETLVAHDSRTAGKGDIKDDTIESWLQALKQYTGNVTVIFDSCHSGDATKDLALTARSLPPNPNTDPGGVRPVTAKGAAENDGLLRGTSYAFISGSRAGELSNEGAILDKNNVSHYRGFLTHYLVTALRLNPMQTYEGVVRRITPDIGLHAPSQHPQAQGKVLTRFLGVSGDQEQPYLKIASVQDSKHFTLDAGAIHGIGPSTLLAVYGGAATKLVGETGKKANARVTKTAVSTSDVELLDPPTRPITKDDKVAIVTPAKGRYRMPVLATAMGSQPTSPQDAKVLAGIAALLNGDHLVELANAKDALFSVQRGCMNAGKFISARQAATLPAASCAPAYYVAARDNLDQPLLDKVVAATEQSVGSQQLANTISLKARQDNLRRIVNLQSPLADKIKITLVKTLESGKEVSKAYTSSSVPRLAVGDKYHIRIANTSNKDLYVAVLVLGSSGQTFLYGDSVNGELIKKSKSITVKPTYTAGKPYGLETYKAFASLRPDVDYTVLISLGSRTTTGKSAFDLLLADYSNADIKDPDPRPGLDLDAWVTTSIDTEIVP